MNNVLAPTNFTTLLVGDTTGDAVVSWTKSGSNYAAACAEFQSASGGVLFPRMTQTQISALPATGQALVAGTMIYNSTTGAFDTYNGAGFVAGSSFVTGSLTAAQVLAMSAAPIELIAAPAAGYGIFIDKFILRYNFAVAFASGGVISLEYGNAAAAAGPLASGTIAAAAVTGGASAISSTVGAALAAVATASINGAAIYISNTVGAFTGGAGSTVNYYISYKVLPVA